MRQTDGTEVKFKERQWNHLSKAEIYDCERVNTIDRQLKKDGQRKLGTGPKEF